MPKSDHRSQISVRHEPICGPAPILPDEDLAAYDDLLARILTDIEPTGAIEDILVRDIVDLTWEILRWRRVRSDLITQAAAAALLAILSRFPNKHRSEHPDQKAAAAAIASGFVDSPLDRKLVRKWVEGAPDVTRRINKRLRAADKTIGSITAEVMIEKLQIIERVDHIVVLAEARRNAALREIDRHRLALARAVRSRISEIEDTEFEALPPIAPPSEIAGASR